MNQDWGRKQKHRQKDNKNQKNEQRFLSKWRNETSTSLPFTWEPGKDWVRHPETGTWEYNPERGKQANEIGKPSSYSIIKPYVPCHAAGPHLVFTKRVPAGEIQVWAGAAMEVDLYTVDAIIDMAGSATSTLNETIGFERARTKLPSVPLAYIHVPVEDGSAPRVNRDFWESAAEDLIDLVPKAPSGALRVLCACVGGHGRTGVAVVALASALEVLPKEIDPVKWLRDKYCQRAVESLAQIKYLEKILGQAISAKPSETAWKQEDNWEFEEKQLEINQTNDQSAISVNQESGQLEILPMLPE